MNAVQRLLTDHLDIWTAADTEKKSGRGRSAGNAASVYGIKKLRELILELAVRGKLVPQDPNDEPASALLKRIQTEKSRSIAEGKIKKGKRLPPIAEGEKPFELPQGWEWMHLPDVSDYKVGKTPSTKSSAYWTNSGDGFNWVSIADLNHDGIAFETSKQITDKAVSEVFRCDPAPAGTILMSFKLTLGKISILDMPAFHNEAIISIYPNQCVFKDFLFKVLPARALAGNSKSAIKGNTLNSESIAALMIPLPPMAEQLRIVAKVDELMALCDQLETQHNNAAVAHEKLVSHLLGTLTLSQSAEDFSANWQRIAAHFDTLFTTEASIAALKQTLLQLAVMGKLVPQDPNDEPASELLKRIQAEKARLIAEGKIRKGKPLPLITDEEKPFSLPQGWEWVRLGVALDITGGVTLGRKITGADLVELPYLRVANVQRGYLVLDSVKTVEIRRSELARYQLLKDDLLVTEGGDWDKVGRTAIWNSEIENCLHQNHIFRMRGVRKELSGSWIEMYMNSIARAYFQAASKQTTNLASINMTQLRNCLIAVPALREQHRIVAKVDELMALCDQLKSRITAASQLQQKLVEVVVEQAVA